MGAHDGVVPQHALKAIGSRRERPKRRPKFQQSRLNSPTGHRFTSFRFVFRFAQSCRTPIALVARPPEIGKRWTQPLVCVGSRSAFQLLRRPNRKEVNCCLVANLVVPSGRVELTPIAGLLFRRALLGILLEARRPLTIDQVVAELHAAGVTAHRFRSQPINAVVADMLRYQVRIGRVERVSRATYAVVASSMSRSTQRRCRHWRDRLKDLD